MNKFQTRNSGGRGGGKSDVGNHNNNKHKR